MVEADDLAQRAIAMAESTETEGECSDGSTWRFGTSYTTGYMVK